MDNAKKLEKVVKGFAHEKRIRVLMLLNKEPSLPLFTICEELHFNVKTGSEHVRRLLLAGLIKKRYKGRMVLHTVTPLGKNVLTFLRKLDNRKGKK